MKFSDLLIIHNLIIIRSSLFIQNFAPMEYRPIKKRIGSILKNKYREAYGTFVEAKNDKLYEI